MIVTCPYCQKNAKQVTGKIVYPHRFDLHEKWFYICGPCGAYVGCHPGTNKPLGRLANQELRSAKQRAHKAFDPLWKTGVKRRKEAYAWLSQRLGIQPKDCHIGMFDVEQCLKVVTVCEEAKCAN